MEKIVKILKRIKIKNLLILVLLLCFNTYAWFLYSTKVSAELTVHINSWNVEFIAGSGEVIKDVLIEVDRIYPGMPTFEKNIEVHNRGETKANLDYEIESLIIMDQTYEVNETMTTKQLEEKLNQEYPFKISIQKEELRWNTRQ